MAGCKRLRAESPRTMARRQMGGLVRKKPGATLLDATAGQRHRESLRLDDKS